MTAQPLGPLLWLAGTATMLAAFASVSGSSRRDDPPKKVAVAKDVSAGISACPTCHSGADQAGVDLFVTMHKSHEYIRLDESVTWRGQDVHSVAHKALESPLGKHMAERLKYDVAKAPQCLACHAVDLTPSAPLPEKQFAFNQGVGCNACHGLKETWQNRHYKESADGTSIPWRTQSPSEKAAAGMHDLRNPAVKARLCAGCHVGNADEGKVVTHIMFAVGHPPLPPFELATYLEGEPRHWGEPADLPYFKGVPAEKTWELYRFHAPEKEVRQTRNVVAGAVAALHAEARLLQAEATLAMKTENDGIDYARFDCYGCHHELRSPSERQARGFHDGPPGRPTLRWGVGALVGVVAEHAEGFTAGAVKVASKGFNEKWLSLRKAATVKPFGNPKEVVDAAGDVAAWCEAFLKALEDSPEPLYSPEQTERLSKMLAAGAMSTRSATDSEAAMTFTWAYSALSKRSPEEKWKRLGEVLPLGVRSAPFFRTENGKPAPMTPRFPDRMKLIREFESKKFLDPFKGLLEK